MYKTVLQNLLDPANLPEYFNTDPAKTAGITLLYSGSSGVVTIEAGVLTTLVNGGSGQAITYNLSTYTLSSLVTALNTNTGYTATLVGTGSMSALALIEVQKQDIVTSAARLYVFNTLVYQIATVMAVAINNNLINVQNAINEQFIFIADSAWLDYWGEIYGDQIRATGQVDSDFAETIMNEITRNRVSAHDIVSTIQQELLLQVAISDHQNDIVKVSGVSFVGQQIIGDRAHAKDQFEVFGLGVDVTNNQQVKNIITANRAAGINVNYTYTTPLLNGAFIMPFMIDMFPISPIVVAPPTPVITGEFIVPFLFIIS